MTPIRWTSILVIILLTIACQKETLQQQATEIVKPTPLTSPHSKSNSTTINGRKFEMGGSNYPICDAQNYLVNKDWDNANFKLVVGDYHQNTALIHSQLQTMYNNGQRKLALPIWFSIFTKSGTRDKHLIRINGGNMSAQHRQNLQNVIREAKRIGFNEITVRFLQQWLSHPNMWTNGWEETTYQQNWNFIHNTVNLVNAELNNSNVRVMYDLGAELGGIKVHQCEPYVRRLWRDYCTVFGNNNSYGFTMAYTKDRLRDYIINLRNAQIALPLEYGIDCNRRIFSSVMKDVSDVLVAENEQHKSIIIQECSYDHSLSLDTILLESIKNNVFIRTVYQWPLDISTNIDHISHNYCENYPMSPYVTDAGRGCTDRNCLWIVGHFFADDARVVTLHPDTETWLGTYNRSDIVVDYTNPNNDLITLRLRTQNERNLSASKGLKVRILNPGNGTTSAITAPINK